MECQKHWCVCLCIRNVILEEGLLGQRVKRRRCVGNGLKPARPDELTGPNQCWTWDISYILTVIKRMYYYLYVMLDEWSRKVAGLEDQIIKEREKQLTNQRNARKMYLLNQQLTGSSL